MKFDPSKPYSETIGPSLARYHQDGRDFDASGQEIPSAETVVQMEPEAVTRKKYGRPPKVVE